MHGLLPHATTPSSTNTYSGQRRPGQNSNVQPFGTATALRISVTRLRKSRSRKKELNMKIALVLLLSCAGLSLAQNTEADPKPAVVKRLASVTWDLHSHKLVWEVQKGTEVNGEFVMSS